MPNGSNKRISLWWVLLISSLALFPGLNACGSQPAGPPQEAQVVRVIDGDTLELAGGRRVRVLGLDAPELEWEGQPAQFLAHKAKAALADLALNQQVHLEYDRLHYDHYNRLLAYIFLPDRTFVNAELVRRGLARVYASPPNLRYQKDLLVAQQEAIAANRGIWQQLLKQDEPSYLGNRHSLRLHRPTCSLAAKMAPPNRVRFTSLKEAYLQGYSPCRSCRP